MAKPKAETKATQNLSDNWSSIRVLCGSLYACDWSDSEKTVAELVKMSEDIDNVRMQEVGGEPLK